jgi:hypothetical protein
MALMAVSAILAAERKLTLAAAVSVITIPFKEAALYAMPLFLIVALMESRRTSLRTLTILGLIVLGVVLARVLPEISGCHAGSQLRSGFFRLLELLINPQRFIAAIAAISMTLGPLLITLGRRQLRSFYLTPGASLALISIPYFCAISIAGGGDVTRLFYSFSPFYAPLIAFSFRNASLSAFSAALLGWMVTNQSLNKYEQPVSDWPNADMSGFFAQSPDHAHLAISVVILAVWAMLYLAAHKLEHYEYIFRNARKYPLFTPSTENPSN